MRSVFIQQFGEGEKAFEIREGDLPTIQGDEVLIEVECFGLNYADVMARKGLYNDAPPIPFVPGYEVVGVVVEKGDKVDKVSVGDRVLAFTLFGAYAEYAKANEKAIVKIPDTIESATATALATQYCTAWYAAIMRGNIQKGERVLIHAAAGGVGTALVQLAKWKGCTVIGTAGSESKLDYVLNNGADYAINYREDNFVKEVKKIHPYVDVAFDPIGGNYFRKNFKLLDKGGRMLMYGVSNFSNKKGTLLDKIKLALDFGIMHPIEMLAQSKGVIGVNMLHVAQSHPSIIENCLSDVMKLAEQKVLKPHISGQYNISQLNEAHRLLGARETIGKLVVHWN